MVKRVGIIGGGQLAWMMAAEVEKLDLELMVQTPSLRDPAVARLAGEHFVVLGAVDDGAVTAELAEPAAMSLWSILRPGPSRPVG